VQFYLIRLSYTAAAWDQQLAHAPEVSRRLASVKRLIDNVGGSLAEYNFFKGKAGHGIAMNGKFVALGTDDLVAVLAVPDERAAHAFRMAVAAEAGVKQISLTPLIPIADAIDVMRMADSARKGASYSAPGGNATTWMGGGARGAGRGPRTKGRRPA